MCVGGRCHCGWQGQLDEVGHGGRWHHDVSLHNRIIGLLLLVASVLVLLLQLDDVMNLGAVTCHTHWCCQTLKGTQYQHG